MSEKHPKPRRKACLPVAHYAESQLLRNMKVFKKLVAAAIVAVACMSAAPSVSAAGPIKFGVKAGISVNDLKFNEELVSSNNRTGFTGGFTAQFVAPIIGIGCDLSAMYTLSLIHI